MELATCSLSVRTKHFDLNVLPIPCDRVERKRAAMTDTNSFSDSAYSDQTELAERELASFLNAVTELFGREQARMAAEDWLEESELMDMPPRASARDWRSVTISASARLASRIDAAQHRRKSLAA